MGKLLSIIETAQRFGMTAQSLRNWMEKGYIEFRTVGRARYIDEDTVNALQDTAEEINAAQQRLERLRDEVCEEYRQREQQRYEKKMQRRYLNLMTGAAIRSDFFRIMVRMLQLYGELNDREAETLTDFLNGMTLEAIGEKYGLPRDRVRMLVEKAIRKSQRLSKIEEIFAEMRRLYADNEVLKQVINVQKVRLAKYEKEDEEGCKKTYEDCKKYMEEHDEICRNLSLQLTDCGLSVRALNCMKAEGIKTVGDLCRLKRKDVLNIRNFGKKTLPELEDMLERMGLSWEMDVDRIYEERMNMI